MSIGKIRNIGGNSGGSIVNFNDKSLWYSTNWTYWKIQEQSDGSYRYGEYEYLSITASGYLITTTPFRLKPKNVISIIGTSHRYAGYGLCNICLVDSDNNETILYQNTQNGGSQEVNVTKSGLDGYYRFKMNFSQKENFGRFITLTEFKVYSNISK